MTEEDHKKHWMKIDGEKDTVFDSFVNKTYKSFHSNDSQREVTETFVFLKEGNTYVIEGPKLVSGIDGVQDYKICCMP